MTNEELIKATRICTNGGNCEDCPSNANATHDCIDVVLQGLADALEQVTKERDAAISEIQKKCKNCKHVKEQDDCVDCNTCNFFLSNWEWKGANW